MEKASLPKAKDRNSNTTTETKTLPTHEIYLNFDDGEDQYSLKVSLFASEEVERVNWDHVNLADLGVNNPNDLLDYIKESLVSAEIKRYQLPTKKGKKDLSQRLKSQ